MTKHEEWWKTTYNDEGWQKTIPNDEDDEQWRITKNNEE